MLDILISVRNRENWRIQQCVNNFKHPFVNKVYVIDYGSKKPIKNIKNADVINYKYDEYPIWNKSHALNLCIKMCKSHWIATVDVDMILNPGFIEGLSTLLTDFEKNNYDLFVYTTNVRRTTDRTGTFQDKFNKSHNWFVPNHYTTKVDGGIQIFNNSWIRCVGGYDESLIYWGGPDNDMHSRALFSGIITLDLNSPILHQEHKKQKEHNLSDSEKRFALQAKIGRREYLQDKEFRRLYIQDKWGLKKPNCRFTKLPNGIE